MRFRVHLARHFNVDPSSVEVQVLGDHGTTEVYVWSGARIAGVPVATLLAQRGEDLAELRERIAKEVRYANISIIEGNDASQFGIGIVSARIAEMIVRDERAVIPIGNFHQRFGVTLSLPSVAGRNGVSEVLEPALSDEERAALAKSGASLRDALTKLQAAA